MSDVLEIQRNLVRSYKDDMVKNAEKRDKAKIKECFESIPNQLSKENKKFQYSVVLKGDKEHCDDMGRELCDDRGHGAFGKRGDGDL